MNDPGEVFESSSFPGNLNGIRHPKPGPVFYGAEEVFTYHTVRQLMAQKKGVMAAARSIRIRIVKLRIRIDRYE